MLHVNMYVHVRELEVQLGIYIRLQDYYLRRLANKYIVVQDLMRVHDTKMKNVLVIFPTRILRLEFEFFIPHWFRSFSCISFSHAWFNYHHLNQINHVLVRIFMVINVGIEMLTFSDAAGMLLISIFDHNVCVHLHCKSISSVYQLQVKQYEIKQKYSK